MKKIFTFIAAMLVAFAVNAQTDFAAPGYSCAADDAVLSGDAGSSKLYLDAEKHEIVFSDISASKTAIAEWTVTATRGCYVSVSLDMGSFIGSSNKHIFDVKIFDSKAVERGHLSQGTDHTGANVVEALDGTILLPVAGVYTVQLIHNRDWCKGAVKNVILTYAADAPAEIIEVSSIALNKNSVNLGVEEVELLTATVLPDNATDPSVTWESSAPAVATVTNNGFVTAIAEGTAIITATAGEKSASCAVTVSAPAIPIVHFTQPCTLSGKKALLEGYIWKNEDYKLYGNGGSHETYGTASWTIHVTRPCSVTGVLNGAQDGQMFVLDLYNDNDELLGSIAQPKAYKWWSGDLEMDSVGHNILTFPAAGDYTLKLRNTLAWSSAKVAGVTLYKMQTLYCKMEQSWWTDANAAIGAYAMADGLSVNAVWPGERMTRVGESNVWKIDVDGRYTSIVFTRINPSEEGDLYWGAKTEDLTIPVDGKNMYTITSPSAIWDPSAVAGVWSVNVSLEDGYYIIGIMGWNLKDLSADCQLIHSNEEYEEWYKGVTLAVGDEFKVVYVENNAISAWYPDGIGNNYIVVADHAGDKTVYFRPDGLGGSGWHEGVIYVQPNPVQLDLVAGWNTVCLPYAAEIANVDAYEIQGINFGSGTISLTPSNGALTAATSYLINAAAAGAHTATLMGGKVTTPVEVDGFRGNLSETPEILDATDANYGYLVLSGNEFHLLLGDATANVAQYKAYIRLGKATAPSVLRIVNGATNIQNVEGNETAVKFIENGKLFIKKNGVVYDAVGAVVK